VRSLLTLAAALVAAAPAGATVRPLHALGRVEAAAKSDGVSTVAWRQPGGPIVVSRSTSGPNPGADLQRLFFLQLRVIGATMGTRAELADLLAFVANTGITPEIGLELPMDRAEEGFRAMLEGNTSGKIFFTR